MKFTDIFKRSTRSNTTPVDYSDPKEGNSYLNNSVFFGDQISRGNMSLSAVYRATEIISDSIAVLPIKVSEITGSGHKDEMTAHPLMKILNYLPGNKLSKYNLMKLLIQSVILKGNGFAYIEGHYTGTIDSYKIFAITWTLLNNGENVSYWYFKTNAGGWART